jgi:hypothetical protein
VPADGTAGDDDVINVEKEAVAGDVDDLIAFPNQKRHFLN